MHGQGSSTRAQNNLKTLDVKINVAATKYCVAHQSLTTLSASLGWVGWQDKLHPLLDEDICSLTNAFDLQLGEGRHQVSWIWQMCGYSDQAIENEAEDGFQEGEWLLITTTFLLTYPSYQPFMWNGARHVHALSRPRDSAEPHCHAPNTFGTVNMEHTIDSSLSWSER